MKTNQPTTRKIGRLFILALLLTTFFGCPPAPDDMPPPDPDPDPEEPTPDLSEDRGVLPIIEFQVNNTASTADDYIGTAPVPCRLRVINQLDFRTDIQVSLENIELELGARALFSFTLNSTQSGFISLLVPANGDWADFYIRPANAVQSTRDKDVIVQMNLRRQNPAGGPEAGTVIGRKAMMITTLPAVFAPSNLELQINNTASTADDYVTWSPTPCRIRQIEGNNALTINLRNMQGTVGRTLFATANELTPHNSTATNPTLRLTLPADGSWVDFYIAGQFGNPSINDKDAIIEITNADNQPLSREALMVRIRKNANTLTDLERDRFLEALVTLNQGENDYAVFNEIHGIGLQEAHFGPAFSPWHRAFILDLERQLQAIDPAVTLPYWRYDRAAPNVFSPDFMGGTSASSVPSFSASNPLALWRIDNMTGIIRSPVFAPNQTPDIVDELAVISSNNQYAGFNIVLETGTHNRAHGLAAGNNGWIGTVPTAVRDPLFFLLHTNVDRLWAKWQWVNDLHAPDAVASFAPRGAFPSTNPQNRIGHYLEDEMWPWNGVTGTNTTNFNDRPSTAPGGALDAVYGLENTPPPSPRIRDMIDYRSNRNQNNVNSGMGYSYDDTPYE